MLSKKSEIKFSVVIIEEFCSEGKETAMNGARRQLQVFNLDQLNY